MTDREVMVVFGVCSQIQVVQALLHSLVVDLLCHVGHPVYSSDPGGRDSKLFVYMFILQCDNTCFLFNSLKIAIYIYFYVFNQTFTFLII